jgi:hypothetical protein
VVVTHPAQAVTQQFTWFDQQVTNTNSSYATPAQSGATPSNWTSPINYAGGRVYTRFQVVSKPSSKPLDVQICAWRNNFTIETCSYTKFRFSDEGTFYINFGAPNSWWKKNGNWSWATPFSPVRWMVKDPNTGKLMQTSSCGGACSTSAAVAGHNPMTFRVAAVVVAPGATLSPPASWTGCPASWSPSCPNPSGATTTTTRPTTTTTRPSTTTTTRPGATTTTTRPTTGGSKVAMIVGSAASIPPKDVPLRNRLVALGKTVVLVDDDGLTASQLSGASLVVVSSSVVPTKIPTWLATQATPLLDLEAYVQTTLRLATYNRELPGVSTLRIMNPSHPLAAGKSGDVAVQSAVALGVADPVASAVEIAQIPGATTASIYGIESGAALTSGNAPARRVGFFTSYDSPPVLTANGWALFDAAVKWLNP